MKIQGMRGLLLASTVFGGTLTAMTLSAAPAMAQQKPAAAEPSAVEEIVVTGSRIRRTDTETPEPVGVVSAEAVKERGFINIADAINDLPQARGSQTTRPGRASQGAAAGRDFISLFNLGSQRTLTLVNGRRFVGSNPAGAGAGGNQVDINNIPTGLVDRVETVQATGGAVYGSDAIAGVVNIILKKNYEGLEIDGQTGISDRGDYRRQLGRVTAGKNFLDGRANVAINLEYSKTDSLNGNERKATDRSYTNATNPKNTSNTDGIPNLILIQDWRVPEASAGGLVFTNTGSALTGLVKVNGSPVTFGPGGVLVPYKVGTVYGPTTAGGDSDGVNFADHITLITGSERYNATLLGRYDLTDNIHLSTELLASKLKAREPTNQNISNVNFSTGASGGITLSLDNAFLQPAARAALIGAGITNTFDISRWHEDIGTALTNDSKHLSRPGRPRRRLQMGRPQLLLERLVQPRQEQGDDRVQRHLPTALALFDRLRRQRGRRPRLSRDARQPDLHRRQHQELRADQPVRRRRAQPGGAGLCAAEVHHRVPGRSDRRPGEFRRGPRQAARWQPELRGGLGISQGPVGL
jgi:iron complex outermembrane receptor protein